MKKELLAFLVALVFIVSGCAPKPASVEITPATPVKLAKAGETVNLAAAARDINGKSVAEVAFIWKSSDEKAAKVDANGTVTAVGSGKALISAAVAPAGEVKGVKDVVVEIIKELAVTPAELTLKVGGEAGRLAAKVFDEKGGEVAGKAVMYGLSDPEIAEVAGDGTVTAKKAGTATITVKSDSLEKVVNLKVEEAEKAAPKKK